MTDLTTRLTERFSVSVITGRPNYHDEDRAQSVPATDTHDGVSVRRVRGTRFDKNRLPLRLINWLSFTLLALLRLLWDHPDDDVVLTLSNPPILPFAAWLNKRLTGTPYVYLIYDVYPDMAVKLGYVSETNPAVRLWKRAMATVYRDADRIVVLGDSMYRHLEDEMADHPAFDVDKIVVIHNWEAEEFIEPMDKADNEFAHEHGTVEKFTLVYSGNIGRFHELETVIDAVGRLKDRGREDIQLLIIGEGARKSYLQNYVEQNDVGNVEFLPFQPLERLPETLTCGDASLVGIKAGMEGLCVSSKLYSSLAAGAPVLAVVGEGDEVARAVTACDGGEHVPPRDADQAADILAKWADNPELVEHLGENARRCFEEQYTLDHAVAEYIDLLLEVAESQTDYSMP